MKGIYTDKDLCPVCKKRHIDYYFMERTNDNIVVCGEECKNKYNQNITISEVVKLDKTFKELHQVKNDICPICDEEFIYLSPIVKLEDKAYHLHCYEKLTIRQ